MGITSPSPADTDTAAGHGKRLVLVELNEVNFDVARQYIQRLGLRSFATLCAENLRRTSSENRYEDLEPWIQWVSAHSGLTAQEHGVFRLGDIVGTQVPQLFEQLEARGLVVGAVSPMNTENRLQRPAYFLPDPWTATPSDGSFWGRVLSQAVSQAVNDNAGGRISARSAATLLLGVFRFARPRHYALYARLAARSRGAPWRKALFLDLFLHDLHWTWMHARRPHFSAVFLNAGAHIQHHYFHNSQAFVQSQLRNPLWYVAADEDPLAEMLQVYDAILADYLAAPGTELIVATGLTQQPYDRVMFYYRLKDHAAFLQQLGIRYLRVFPRMTRDFLIEFESADDALDAQRQLGVLKMAGDDVPVFGEIDNRGNSLFVTLTYPNMIALDEIMFRAATPIALAKDVVFVSIKNGMHASHGYMWCSSEVARFAPDEGAHVKELHNTVMRFFGVKQESGRSVLAQQDMETAPSVMSTPAEGDNGSLILRKV